jgi:two-component system, NarL family, response regulator
MTPVAAFDNLTSVMPQQPQRSHPLDVLIVDDQASARHGLAALLALQPNIRIVGEAADGREAIALAGRFLPDVVLMDIEMPLMDGAEATRRIKQLWPRMHVVILSVHDECYDRLRKEGASDFLLKGEPTERLLRVLHRLHEEIGSD